MTAYEYNPIEQSVHEGQCVNDNLVGRTCLAIGSITIRSDITEFVCRLDDCPLIGGLSLQAAVESEWQS